VQDTLHISSGATGKATPAHATDSSAAAVHYRKAHVKHDSLRQVPASSIPEISSGSSDTIRFNNEAASNIKLVNIWKTHELKPVHDSPRQLQDSNPDWLFLVLIIVLGVLTYLRVFYRKNFFQVIAACFNNNLTNQIVRDENLLMQRASVMLNVTFSIIVASFIYLVSIHYDWSLDGIGTGFIRFVFLALLVSAAFTLKFLVLRLCAFLFNLGREMSTYIFNIFIINNLLGIALVPIVALILFGNILNSSILIILAVCIIGIAYLYRIGRGILIATGYPGFSPVYLFLYLCALEIAPLLVLVKLVSLQ
jgi:hypothetical protein